MNNVFGQKCLSSQSYYQYQEQLGSVSLMTSPQANQINLIMAIQITFCISAIHLAGGSLRFICRHFFIFTRCTNIKTSTPKNLREKKTFWKVFQSGKMDGVSCTNSNACFAISMSVGRGIDVVIDWYWWRRKKRRTWTSNAMPFSVSVEMKMQRNGI